VQSVFLSDSLKKFLDGRATGDANRKVAGSKQTSPIESCDAFAGSDDDEFLKTAKGLDHFWIIASKLANILLNPFQC
jgi:hypothetical protein